MHPTKKKYWVFGGILAALVCLLLFATSWNELRFMAAEDAYRNARINSIIEAIQAQDVNAIKRIFSKEAVEAVGEQELEDGIRYLFTVFQGEVQSIDMKGGGYGDSFRRGLREKHTSIWANVTTDVDTYVIFCPEVLYSSIDWNTVGIERLVVAPKADLGTYGGPMGGSLGVYRMDIVIAAAEKQTIVPDEEKVERVIEALQSDDAEDIVTLFSERAMKEVGRDNLLAGAEYSCDAVGGNIIEWDASNASKLNSIANGKVRTVTTMDCIVYTDEDTYYIYYRDVIIDENHPERVGIDQLRIEDDWASSHWPYASDVVGIYCPENSSPGEYTNKASKEK